MAAECECPTYANIIPTEETSYQIVAEKGLETSNEYTALKESAETNSAPTLKKKSSDLTAMKSRTARRFKYTDVVLNIPTVTKANRMTANQDGHLDPVCKDKKMRPTPPPKPTMTINSHNSGTVEKQLNRREMLRVVYKHCFVTTAAITVAVALIVAVAGLVVAVLSYGSLQECEHLTEHITCEITPDITVHQYQGSNLQTWLLSNNTCSTLPKTANVSKVNILH